MSTILGRRAADLDARFEDPPVAPEGMEAAAPTAHRAPHLPAGLDDAAMVYVLEMQPAFDLLRQAMGQLAALLVLAAAGGKSVAGHPMLALTEDALVQAADTVHTVRVPPLARHHHRHVVEAERATLASLVQSRRIVGGDEGAAVDGALKPLRAAHRHLLWATNALPGFELVALGQSCCAEHARSHGAAPA